MVSGTPTKAACEWRRVKLHNKRRLLLRAPGACRGRGFSAFAQLRGRACACRLHEFREQAVRLLQKLVRAAVLRNFARVHHNNLVEIDDGVEAVRNGYNRALRERTADSFLHSGVCRQIH